MFHKRSAHKPSDAFLRDFQRKFSGVAAIPYTLGAGTVPDQLFQWNAGEESLPGLGCNLPSPVYSSSPPSQENCSCGGLNDGRCAVLHDNSVDEDPAKVAPYSLIVEPWLLDSTYAVPQDLGGNQGPDLQYQGHMSDTIRLPTYSPREISPADSQLNRSSSMDETRTAYHSQQPPRFQVTLHAPTATYDPSRQLPVTYLNRCQGYKISIIDTVPPVSLPHPVRYRTHFRIAFDNKQQRADPTAAWRLWRGNRGLHEASRVDGQLRAVEFVDGTSKVIRGRAPGSSQVALENSSLDGFSIVWLADPQSGHAGCEAHILFNFLSTDFTLSKGVQGVPLRLYAKTELIAPDVSEPGLSTAEINYCRVKLFRDHGSERKLSNDAVKLKKAIAKVHGRLDAVESGAVQGRVASGKRKRGKPPVAAEQPLEPCLTMTHDFSACDELRQMLSDLETVMSSSQPRSALWLRGDVEDDPDRFPIVLSNPLQAPEGPARGATESSSPTDNRTQNHGHNYNYAAACFYILRRIDRKVEDYYRAMYLHEQTLPNLLHQLAQTYQLGPSSISRAIRVNAAGLRIVVDDDVVKETPHGQDMIVEISPDPDHTVGSSPRFRATLLY